ncbi:MAG: hypothetical protein C4527_17170 [Candidatus Omnitrophota bacterium]|jgi:hypothetical protein|nr:MAG: hypothetical protein C4527_17170 [Candidatus Omnitrophota bacterium]
MIKPLKLLDAKPARLFFTFFSLLTITSPIVMAKEARIPAGTVLERAVKAWEPIHDYQAYLHMTEQHPTGQNKENWARISVVQATDELSTDRSACLIELFDHPLSSGNSSSNLIIQATEPTPAKIYFSDGVKIYTFVPKGNTVTIEWLDQRGPLPEFMQLAGFLELDIEELKQNAYLDDEVLEEIIDDVPTYRVKITPRQKVKSIEPTRYIWIDRETWLPKRFAYESQINGSVEFLESRINQGLLADRLIPEVTNPNVYNLTQ